MQEGAGTYTGSYFNVDSSNGETGKENSIYFHYASLFFTKKGENN